MEWLLVIKQVCVFFFLFKIFFTDVAPFIEFLKSIPDGTIVFMGTYDDGATKYVIDLHSKYCLNF